MKWTQYRQSRDRSGVAEPGLGLRGWGPAGVSGRARRKWARTARGWGVRSKLCIHPILTVWWCFLGFLGCSGHFHVEQGPTGCLLRVPRGSLPP